MAWMVRKALLRVEVVVGGCCVCIPHLCQVDKAAWLIKQKH